MCELGWRSSRKASRMGSRWLLSGLAVVFVLLPTFSKTVLAWSGAQLEAGSELHILLVGNSITLGKKSSDELGFRDGLHNLLETWGVTFDFVGDTGEPPYEGWFFSGAKAPEFYPPEADEKDITPEMNTYHPELVLIHLGTNDITDPDIVPYSENNGATLTDQVSGKLVGLWEYVDKWHTGEEDNNTRKILICKIFPRLDLLTRTWKLNREILRAYHDSEQGTDPRLPPGSLILVDQYSGVDQSTMVDADSIHPNDLGYGEMANSYFDGVLEFLQQQDGAYVFAEHPDLEHWEIPSDYAVQDSELVCQSGSDAWGDVAGYLWNRDPRRLSLGLGDGAAGAPYTPAFALLLDTTSTSASGYALYRENNGKTWVLERLENGALGAEIVTASGSAALQAGDTLSVQIREDADGRWFTVRVNGIEEATLVDSTLLPPIHRHGYAGLLLRGNGGTPGVRWYDSHMVPDVELPGTVNDLQVTQTGPHHVRLTWTAPGDDQNWGKATRYDLRYSTSQIDAHNFFDAEQVAGVPVPGSPGSVEEVVVSGLKPNTRYTFAVRAFDETDNMADVSNVVSATTEREPPLVYLRDDFDRTELGVDWHVPDGYGLSEGRLTNSGAGSSEIAYTTIGTGAEGVRAGLEGSAGGEPPCLVLVREDNGSGVAVRYTAQNVIAYAVDDWQVDFNSVLDQAAPASGADLLAGDVLSVGVSWNGETTDLRVYLNGEFEATLNDSGRLGDGSQCQAGLWLPGGDLWQVDFFETGVEQRQPGDLELVSGDNQEAEAGQALPEPLVTRARDEAGNPVPGVEVDYRVVEGTGRVTSDSLDFDGKIWLEAEHAGLTYEVQVLQDVAASGGAYAATTWDRHGEFQFFVQVPESGSYKLWARARGVDNVSDSFLAVVVDQADTVYPDGTRWSIDITSDYEWQTDEDLVFDLSRGAHTVEILCREKGTRLDKILLTADLGYTPSEAGGAEWDDYIVTDRQGLARAWLTLGNERGEVRTRAVLPWADYAGVDSVEFVATATASTEGTIFADVTDATGTGGRATYGGHGVAFVDVAGDTLPDLYVTNAIRDEELDDLFLENVGGTSFQDKTSGYGLQDPGLSHGIVAADVDNDGDLDYFNGNTDKPNRLYIWNGTAFVDESADRGIVQVNGGTRGVVAFDADGDGDLDLYAGNWGGENEFYRNDGSGHFAREDVGANDAEGNDYGTQGVTATDFDGDGDVDLYVVMRGTTNRLFVNDGTGHFTRGESAAGIDRAAAKGNGATFADIDNDGDLDLLLAESHESSGQTVYLRIYRNNGDGTFTDETDQHQIGHDGYSVAAADMDNDGDLDLILASTGQAPRLFLNDGTGHFRPNGNDGLSRVLGDPRGVAVADYDGDGDVDFYVAVKDGENLLARNDLDNDNHWLNVLVIGPGGDWGGVGAKIYVYEAGYLNDPDHLLGFREVQAGFGYLGENDLVQHFGLKGHQTVDVAVHFVDGSETTLTNVQADKQLKVEAPHGVLGDVNADGFANSTDALIILSCDVGIDVSQYCPMSCGDVNGDGYVNSTDALIILSYDVGIEVPYDVGQPGCPANVEPCLGCGGN